jgi:hypothetical protein
MQTIATGHGLSGMSQWVAGLLPTPHLLDAAWWFDSATVQAFRLEMEALPRQATVVFLGTPSLFLDARQRGESRNTLLIDRDAAVREQMPEEVTSDVQVLDLLSSTPCHMNADLIVADPPWYVNETMAFLTAAQTVARIGAQIQICLPPEGTRSTIREERDELFRWAATGGLRLLGLLEGKVRYEAPPFEVNVFRTTKQPLEKQSRVGDLAIFVVESRSGLALPLTTVVASWADHSILGVRLRVRLEIASENDSPELMSLGFCHDIFPSCSKRHDQRETPSVWTSGNRAFCCDNPQRFLSILRSLTGRTLEEVSAGAFSLYPKDESKDARTVAQILALLDVEHHELEALKQCPNGKEM